jgi:hypothetical protein
MRKPLGERGDSAQENAEKQSAYLSRWEEERRQRQQRKDEAYAKEAERIGRRRRELGLGDVEYSGKWGLAVSGGGIRSATCGLGVLQALATCDSPVPDKPAGDGQQSTAGKALLREFDYVSSVSGGGYISGFFTSLFVPGRLTPGSTPTSAASDAYKALQYEPPGRMHRHEEYRAASGAHVGKGPLAWLRENGRYLTPTGGGDLMYAAALTIRNWFAIQYVLGTLLLAVLSLLALLRSVGAVHWPMYADLERRLLPSGDDGGFWWSPLWMLPLAVLSLWMAPIATAFWLTHARKGENDSTPPDPFSLAACCSLGLGLVLGALAWFAHTNDWIEWSKLPWILSLLAAIALLGFAAHVLTIDGVTTISEHRVQSTRLLASGLQWLLVAAAIAFADTLGQHLYLLATRDEDLWKSLAPGAVLGGLVWLLRRLAAFFDEKNPSWISKVPVNVLAGIAGAAMLLLIITVWAVFVQWMQWRGAMPTGALITGDERISMTGGMFAVFLALSLTSARFPGFLNLSTLQLLYGARLTRAYLGASNGARFEPTENQANRSAAEPLPGDQISHANYYADNVLAPLHLINVTLNQTIDPAEQLVQRDRKGQPLAITPNGFTIDGQPYDFVRDPRASINSGKGSQEFTIGQWIGISGAAFTTGLGRSTSLGVSLALGLANVRLGMWWSSGYGADGRKSLSKQLKSAFRTQAFLVYELLAMFHGLRREWQYLSDGGHYENTAAYELLRPERNVKFIVVCDHGCDPEYQFGDLANLIRLARIDYRLEIEVDEGITADRDLSRYFGVPSEFQRLLPDDHSLANEKCALLLNVYRQVPEKNDRALACRVILLKPRLLPTMPVDLREYQKQHPAFPQEPTADQFFDEAQWESYRCLGYCVGRRIFGNGVDEVGPALWRYLATAV